MHATLVNREMQKYIDGEQDYRQPWSPWDHDLTTYFTDDDYFFDGEDPDWGDL